MTNPHRSPKARHRASLLILVAALGLAACSTGTAGTGGAPGVDPEKTAPAVTAAAPTSKPEDVRVLGYEFPAGALDASSNPDGILSRVGATVALPATKGPHPVVLIIHGSYPNCLWMAKYPIYEGPLNTVQWEQQCGTEELSNGEMARGKDYVKWDASFATLARQIASQGMVAVAIDVSAKDNLDFGEPDPAKVTQMLIDLHLGLLKDFQEGKNHGLDLPAELKGSMDLSKVSYVGHSSGGGFVADQLQHGRDGITSAVLLQPAADVAEGEPFAHPAPVLVVSGQCDEQANPDDVAEIVPRIAARNQGAPTISAVGAGATHVAMLGGGSHSIGLVNPVESAECATLTPAGKVRTSSAVLVADFLRQANAGNTAYELGTSADAPIEVTSASSAATVSTTAVSLPDDLMADKVTFLTSEEKVLPEFTGQRVRMEG